MDRSRGSGRGVGWRVDDIHVRSRTECMLLHRGAVHRSVDVYISSPLSVPLHLQPFGRMQAIPDHWCHAVFRSVNRG